MSPLEQELDAQLYLARHFPQPEIEYRFATPRRWRFDFAWPEQRIAVECEGATWASGRHTRGAGYASDCEKYNEAAIRGWLVIRATGQQIESGQALAWIERAWQTAQQRDRTA